MAQARPMAARRRGTGLYSSGMVDSGAKPDLSPSRPDLDAYRAPLAHRLRQRICGRVCRPEVRGHPAPTAADVLSDGPFDALVVTPVGDFATTPVQALPQRPGFGKSAIGLDITT